MANVRVTVGETDTTFDEPPEGVTKMGGHPVSRPVTPILVKTPPYD